MAYKTPSKPNKQVADDPYSIPAGWRVAVWGLLGAALAAAPAGLLLLEVPKEYRPWTVVGLVLWAVLVGHFVTSGWVSALHERISYLRTRLERHGLLSDDEQKKRLGRLPWMPAVLGLFERAFYSMLVGLAVSSGASFIAVWVGLKLAGGWQVWSKGTTFGHALFFVGLLGNAMSVLFGVVAGLVINTLITPS
jgi:hypothetical protein